MFSDSTSLKSSESSVFDPSPNSPEQCLILKSIVDEGLLGRSTPTEAKVRKCKETEHFTSKFLGFFDQIGPKSGSNSPGFYSKVLLDASLQTPRPQLPKLPLLPGTKPQANSREPSIPDCWESYPILSSEKRDTQEFQGLGLTSGYSLPAATGLKSAKLKTTKSKTADVKLHSRRSNRDDCFKIKIHTDFEEEVLVLRRNKDSIKSMNELLGTIIRKLESRYKILPSDVKLYLTFSNENLRPVELFMGDPSSCLFTPLIWEYIHGRSKIQVMAKMRN